MKTVLNKETKALLLQILKQGYLEYEDLESLAFSAGYGLHQVDTNKTIDEKKAELKELLEKIEL